MPSVLFTVGHSTRPIDEFVAMLSGHGVTLLVDVRTVPKSRHNPQFEREALANAMQCANIGYQHEPGLGGFRRPRPDSVNTGWRNASFRGYADYMQTPEFAQCLDHVMDASATRQVAIMCAEAVPWRCHRSLIADALLVRGVDVREIVSPSRTQPHRLTSFAQVDAGRLTYPPEQTGAL